MFLKKTLAILLFATSPLLANSPPAAPFINEPGVDGQIVNPADVHLETHPFEDADIGADGDFRGTDFEIWSVSPSQRVWHSLGMTGVESFHTHLGDGVFENSHAGRVDLLFDTDYLFRVRHRDNSSDPATEYSPWSQRPFRTGSPSAIFPILLLDVLDTPVPLWRSATNQPVILPAGATPPSIRLTSEDGDFDLLEIRGNDGVTNTVINPAAGDHDHAFKILLNSGSGSFALPPTTLVFSDNLATPHTVYLPSFSLGAGQTMVLWVSLNGSTYHGSLADTSPSFSNLARGSAVPWAARQPGYVVEVVASGFRMPVNVVFIPNPGPDPEDPLYYVTELYGTIKVVRRDGTVSTYADNLLNYTPSGAFPGSGEQGLGGLAVHPATGDVYVTMLRSNAGTGNNPRLVKFTSTDGGLTAATQTVLLDMAPEAQGQSHFCSNLTIGPDDKLYLHNGDGFDAGTALNLDQYRGKILRVNLDGSAPSDNPFYNAGNGINARDYVWAYGFRNPFGGAWRAADGQHYEVENGPSRDRFAKVTGGTSYGWAGANADMSINALYNWEPSTGPVNLCFIQPDTFSGSAFPAGKMGRAYDTLSGPTYASGPQGLGKRIDEFQLDGTGALVGTPQTLVEYNGSGRATACGIAAGPDGLYFTDLYRDTDSSGPTDGGANVLRVRFTGFARFQADVTSGELPLEVSFADTSEVPGATAWSWDFGDGNVSSSQNPVHTYTSAGLYSVSLSVTGANGVVLTRRSSYIAAGVEPPAVNHRYYRFTPTKLRNGAVVNSVQLAEFEFLREGLSVIPDAVPFVSNPGGNNPANEPPANLVDRSADTKWLDYNKGAVVFDFGDAMQIDAYGFTTANDVADRDPVSWTLEGSDDGLVWHLLDSQTDHATPTARKTAAGPFSAVNEQAPRILAFTADNPLLEPGQSTTLRWQTDGAQNAVLTPAPGVVSATGTLEISPSATQIYTLTAGNGVGSTSATRRVEVRERTPATYRYFRFTPTGLRDDATSNSVQLAEFDLFRNGAPVEGAAATNPGRDGVAGEEAPMALDNDTATKWNDHNKGALVLTYPAPVTVDGYGLTTANDHIERDPVSWMLEGSANGTAWTLLDIVADYPVTLDRLTATPDIALPVLPERVLFVVAESTNPNASELAVADRLAGLGFAVDFITDSASTTASADGKALIIVSSTVTSGQVAAKFRNVAVPLICWEHAIFDDLGMTANLATDHNAITGQTSIQITAPEHPLAAGHSGTLAVYAPAGNMCWGLPSAGAVKVATVPGDAARATIFAYEQGDVMIGLAAPARRLGFFFEDIGGELAADHAWHLLEKAVTWAVNSPPAVTFTSPAPGARVQRGATLSLEVQATGEALVGVEFRNGSSLLGTVTTPPYTFEWADAPAGSHSLTATVIDAVGETATSPSIPVTVLTAFDAYREEHFTPAQLEDELLSGPSADFDHDGFNTLLEHFFGMDPVSPDRPMLYEAKRADTFGEVSFRHIVATADLEVVVEGSTGLGAWESGGDRLVFVGSIDHGDGTQTSTYRSLLPDEAKEFFRISVSLEEP